MLALSVVKSAVSPLGSNDPEKRKHTSESNGESCASLETKTHTGSTHPTPPPAPQLLAAPALYNWHLLLTAD